LLSTFVAIINLCVVGYIFISTRRFSIKSIRFEKQTIWYRNLAIEPNLLTISNFYKDSQSIIEEGQNQIILLVQHNNQHQEVLEKTKHVADEFNTKLIELRKEFIDVLSSLNPQFGEKINNLFDELQDSVTPQIGILVVQLNPEKINYSEIFRKHKVKLFKMLYDYEIVELCSNTFGKG
jgi:hypothetical protein